MYVPNRLKNWENIDRNVNGELVFDCVYACLTINGLWNVQITQLRYLRFHVGSIRHGNIENGNLGKRFEDIFKISSLILYLRVS